MIIKYGDRGSVVAALQTGLGRSGYYNGTADGIFGRNTELAVMSLQRNFGLIPDGIISNETLNIISGYIKGYYEREIIKGDTLWKIAADNGISLKLLENMNPFLEAENLRIGSIIRIPYRYNIVPTDIEYSSFLTELISDGLCARFPEIKRKTFGKSVMGKNIEYLSFGKGKNSIFINAGFHANEWLNIPLVLKFTEEFFINNLKNRLFNGFDTEKLLNNTVIKIAPLINPDGLDIVTSALTKGNYYINAEKIAESYPSVPFPQGWKANINGVDLNLQFPAMWEKAKEIKAAEGFISPSPIEFVGFSPLSEPEAKAVYDMTLSEDFRIMLAYHSQGNIIYWKYLDYLPPESERIGNNLSNASGYPLELTPYNSSFAGYKDWFIKKYNRPAYTIETGSGINPLPLSEFSEIYEANKKLILEAIREASESV